MEELFLIIAIGAALDYGVRRAVQPPSWERTLTKVTATIALALWAALLGAPEPVIVALGFSAVGDYSGSRGAMNWMLLSAVAFLAVHAIYVVEYIGMINRAPQEAGPALLLALAAVIGLLIVCWKGIASRWLVSVIYSGVILVQFSVGQLVGGEHLIVAYTTTLFFISAFLLGMELFLIDRSHPLRRYTSMLVWVIYFAAQILTVIALTDFAMR